MRGDIQCPGIHFDATFSPVVKPSTIRSVLTIIASQRWPAHQLDVLNTFLHDDISERVYCKQPIGFQDPARPDEVCILARSLYGLRQAPHAWFHCFVRNALDMGFSQSHTDSSLFIYRKGSAMAYLLLYVDDMILSPSTPELLLHLVASLKTV
jgi:histone deacetylase 1/2